MKWFRFYHDAIDDPKVQRLPGDVFKFWVNLLCLASKSNQRGVVTASIEDIAFDVRLDDDTAATMMAELLRRGLIEEYAEGFAIHNWDARQFKSDDVSERVQRYRAKNDNSGETPDETLRETLHVTSHETLKPSVNSDSQINRVTEGTYVPGADAPKPKPPRKRTSSKNVLTPEQLARFERWYSEFPRKVNRAKAEEMWARIDPDDALVDVMVSKTREWAASPDWTKDDGQYVPHPATWLYNKRWTDGAPRQPGTITVLPGTPNPNKRGGYTAGELMQLAEQERRRESS